MSSNKDTINKKITGIRQLIKSKKITAAISRLEEIASDFHLFNVSDRLNKIKDTYGFMIDFLLRGIKDDSRKRMLHDIQNRLYDIADELTRHAETPESPEKYYEALRTRRHLMASLPALINSYNSLYDEIQLVKSVGDDIRGRVSSKQKVLKDIFNYVWTLDSSDSDYLHVKNAVESTAFSHELKCQLVAALTLGLLKFYNSDGFEVLLSAYENTADKSVKARALAGIMIIMSAYADRVASDSKIVARISLWIDEQDKVRELNEMLMSLVRPLETQKVTDKMKNELMPGIMKIQPEILKKMRDASFFSDVEDLDNNPEWEEMLKKNGIASKLQELTELQQQGADVLMAAFSNLKEFPFFRDINNWFLPFDLDNVAAFAGQQNFSEIVERIMDMDATNCDSDKYSMVLSFATMPDSRRDMMISQMESQFEGMKDELAGVMLKKSDPTFTAEAAKYIKDLYRFFKLYRNRTEFDDPFAGPFDFTRLPEINKIFNTPETLKTVGEFYFKRSFYANALPIFMSLASYAEEASDSLLWEKIGYCNHVSGDFRAAYDAYRKAELLKTPGDWLKKKLAIVSKHLGNYEEALGYLNSLMENDPENLSLIMNCGDCSMALGDIDGGLKHYYHANYLSPDNVKVVRAIARAEMHRGDFDKSKKYFSRLLSGKPSANDYLYAGHLALREGKYQEALDMYRKSGGVSAEGFDAFEMTLLADLPELEQLGVDTDIVYLLLDRMRP